MKRLLQPDRAESLRAPAAAGRRLDILAPDLADIDQQDAVRAEALARRREMVAVVARRCRGRTAPSRTWPRGSRSRRTLRASSSVCCRRVAEELRGVGRLLMRPLIAEQPIDRLAPRFARAGPTAPSPRRTRYARPAADPCCPSSMRGGDARDVGGIVDRAVQHRSANRPAGAVRHRAYEGGDGHERRGLALAPADMAAGSTRTSKASWLPSPPS